MGKKKGKSSSPAVRGIKTAFGVIGRIFGIFFLILVITGCISATLVTIYVMQFVNADVGVDLRNLNLGYTSILYYTDKETGEERELQRLQNTQNRIWVDLEDIPQMVRDVAIVAEDRRFEEHNGVDWKRTIFSFVNEFLPLTSSRQGGSTLTQQLIKNITSDDGQTFERKIREIFRALNLEKKYTKDDILEAYLNTVNFGSGTYGIQAASNIYFGKDVSELTVPEAASIIAATKSPVYLNPSTNPERNKERRDWIIGEMADTGLITEEEAEAYQAMPVETIKKQLQNDPNSNSQVQSYFVDTVYYEVIDDLCDTYGYERAFASSLLLNSGYHVYTTIDPECQAILDHYFLNPQNMPPVLNSVYPQGAGILTDPYGKVLAICGGTGEKTGALTLNRATSTPQQPGSSIKPLTVYSQGIENNLITWSTMIEDSPFRDKGDGTGWPVNFNGLYLGNITVAEAIQRSTNTVAVKLADRLGPQNLVNFLVDSFGFDLVLEGPVNDVDIAPMALGALSEGVNPIDMVGAFQIFGNGGVYVKPYTYTRVLDSDGNVILEKNTTPKRVLSPETAAVMNRLLISVTDPNTLGTAKQVRFSSQVVGGKTGTTSNDFDHWFIGYSPYYVFGSWLGYDQNTVIQYNVGHYPPLFVFKSIMGDLHANLPLKDFDDGDNCVALPFCTECGNIASSATTTTSIGYYKPSFIPPTCTGNHGENEEEPKDEEDDKPHSNNGGIIIINGNRSSSGFSYDEEESS